MGRNRLPPLKRRCSPMAEMIETSDLRFFRNSRSIFSRSSRIGSRTFSKGMGFCSIEKRRSLDHLLIEISNRFRVHCQRYFLPLTRPKAPYGPLSSWVLRFPEQWGSGFREYQRFHDLQFRTAGLHRLHQHKFGVLPLSWMDES